MEAASASLRRARPLLGTFVEIAVACASVPAMEAAVEAAFTAVAMVHRLMSFHEPDSDVSRLNCDAASGPVRVHDWTWQVLEIALDIHRRSCGAFDVAVAPTLQELGLLPRARYGASSPSPRIRSRVYPTSALNTSKSAVADFDCNRNRVFPISVTQISDRSRKHPTSIERVGVRSSCRKLGLAESPPHPPPPCPPPLAGERRVGDDLSPQAGRGEAPDGPRSTIQLLPDNGVRFVHDGVKIDLGGIAKGFAVDRAVAALRRHEITEGLVNAGGDLAAFGPRAHTVHIRDPRRPDRLLCRTDVANAALATSGGRFDPLRSAEIGGCAVIDPSGRAPACGILGATVCAPSCVIADALTKVVMNRGEGATAALEHYGASALFVAAGGDVHVTADWNNEVRFAA